MKTTLAGIFVMVLVATAYAGESESRFARMFEIANSPEVVVITEGDFEARSGGSYALRIYGGASHKYPLDDFVTGMIRPRQGVIERVSAERVDGDAIEIMVVIRSVGTGGYLSADAFRYRAKSLIWIASVAGLDKRADPLVALREKSQRGERASP